MTSNPRGGLQICDSGVNFRDRASWCASRGHLCVGGGGGQRLHAKKLLLLHLLWFAARIRTPLGGPNTRAVASRVNTPYALRARRAPRTPPRESALPPEAPRRGQPRRAASRSRKQLARARVAHARARASVASGALRGVAGPRVCAGAAVASAWRGPPISTWVCFSWAGSWQFRVSHEDVSGLGQAGSRLRKHMSSGVSNTTRSVILGAICTKGDLRRGPRRRLQVVTTLPFSEFVSSTYRTMGA